MSGRRGRGPLVLGVAGFVVALACAGAMVLAAVGVVGVAATAGMAGMGSPAAGETGPLAEVLRFLVDAGPTILVVSVAAVALASAALHRAAVLPALVGGAVLYWGMYAQARPAAMYASIALGLLMWVATYLWARRLLWRRGDPA